MRYSKDNDILLFSLKMIMNNNHGKGIKIGRFNN